MIKKLEYENKQNLRLAKSLQNQFPNLSYENILRAIRKKDVLVCGKRVKDNVKLNIGDTVVIYVEELKKLYSSFYEDENILIVSKQKGIEVCDGENNVLEDLQKSGEFFAVHRIDKNTSGLVVFAKNQKSYAELYEAFKNGGIKKYYQALVFGVPKEKQKLLTSYLIKDSKQAFVKVYDNKIRGAEVIKTKYTLLENLGEVSKLEVELFTGKTHQIRAHLAHIGLPIVGDEKYGDHAKNKMFGKKKQCLVAYKIVFNFNKNCNLCYLNDKKFELENVNL